ncbi:MAG TPA: RidA family protein [Chloroflexota bacterium]|nr:RidA family protein [Chloroflexota bacterium]
MEVQHVDVPSMFGAELYSHAVRVGSLLFCSGMSAREPDGSVHAPGDPAEQARYCFEKLRRILAEAGCGFRDVVKVTTYVTDLKYRVPIAEVRRQYLEPPLPASTGVVVSSLSDPALVFEIDAIAAIPSK